MPKRVIQTLWWLTWVACLVPVATLGWRALHGNLGADPVQTITHFTGDWTLRLLLASLSITPIRRLTPRLAWLILSALAATSSAWAIRKLGGKRWQALHRLVYVAAIAGVLHYWWLVKPGVRTPLNDTAVLTLLLLARIVWELA